MTLAERVKKRRRRLGLTQVKAAALAGIRQQSWGSIEEGKTSKPRNIAGIASALQCSPDWLMNGGPLLSRAEVDSRKIPLINVVQAGAFAEKAPITGDDGNFEYVLTDMDWSREAFALKIEGDSMAPSFHTGDVVIIDPDIEPQPGEFVVAKNGDHEATFKKYRLVSFDARGEQVFELVPLNTDYPVMRSDNMPIRVIGTMVEHRIYRRKR